MYNVKNSHKQMKKNPGQIQTMEQLEEIEYISEISGS